MLTGKRLQYLADLLPENVSWGDPLNAIMLDQILTAHSAGAQEPVRWEIREQYDDGNWSAWMICSKESADHYKQFPNKEIRSLYTHPQPMTQTDAARDVLAERQRQIEVEGFSPTHDSKQTPGDLARAAACYAMHAAGAHTAETHPPYIWPRNWTVRWWKPGVSRRDLVKAAALALAEIERIDRAKGE